METELLLLYRISRRKERAHPPSRKFERSGSRPRPSAAGTRKDRPRACLFSYGEQNRRAIPRPAWGERERGWASPLANLSEADHTAANGRGYQKRQATGLSVLVRAKTAAQSHVPHGAVPEGMGFPSGQIERSGSRPRPSAAGTRKGRPRACLFCITFTLKMPIPQISGRKIL